MSEQKNEHIEVKLGGYKVGAGYTDITGAKIAYSLITDSAQGHQWTEDGRYFEKTNKTSYEICGIDCDEKEPAKIILAENGDIIINAEAGDIILKGRNIRVVAMDGVGEVTINSAKQIAMTAPVVNAKSTTENSMASLSHSVGANYVDQGAGVSATSGVATDATQGSFLGGLMKILQKFKQWLECAPGK